MYKLTIELKTTEELINFVSKLNSPLSASLEVKPVIKEEVVAVEEVSFGGQELPPVIEDKPKAKKPKAKTVEVKEEMIEVQSPFKETVVEFTPIDRDALIAQATSLVGKLKSSGISDDKIMPAIHEVYAQAGCALNLKISQFNDESLAVFIPLFEAKVKSIVTQVSAPKQEASFI